jgi:hypothetical protein
VPGLGREEQPEKCRIRLPGKTEIFLQELAAPYSEELSFIPENRAGNLMPDNDPYYKRRIHAIICKIMQIIQLIKLSDS